MSGNQGSPVGKGMYHLFLGNASSTLMLLISSVIIGRILGPSDYGLYTVALIVPPFLFTTIRLGMDAAATRYGARLRSEGKEGEAVSFVYASTIFAAVTAMAFAFVFLFLSGPIANSVIDRPGLAQVVLPIAMVSVVGQAAFTVTVGGLTGLHRTDRAGLVQSLQGATRLLISPILVVLGFGVTGAVVGYTAGFLVSGAVGIVFVAMLSRGSFPPGFWGDVKLGLRYGFPVYISVLAAGVVAPAINIALAITVSNTQIGGYTAAAAFNTAILLFTYPIATALFPLFSRRIDDMKIVGESYGKSLRFTALLVLPIVFFMGFFAGPLVTTAWGRAYSFGGAYLALLAVIALLVGVGSQNYNPLLNGLGKTREALVATGTGSLVAIAVAYFLIRDFGVTGAILGQLAGQVVGVALGSVLAKSSLNVELGVFGAWRIYLACALTSLVSYPAAVLVTVPELAVVAGGVLFAALYVPFLAMVKALDKEDLGTLRGYFAFSPVLSRPLDLAIRYYERTGRAVRLIREEEA